MSSGFVFPHNFGLLNDKYSPELEYYKKEMKNEDK